MILSTLRVELSVDLRLSFLISRKGTFVIFTSETTIIIMRENKIDSSDPESFEMFAFPLFVFISQ